MKLLYDHGLGRWITVACLVTLAVALTVVSTAAVTYFDLKGTLARTLESEDAEEAPAAADPSTESKGDAVGKVDFFLPNRAPELTVSLVGLYGNAALLAQGNDVKQAAVGDSVLGVKVLAIRANGVDVEWNGKTVPLLLFPVLPATGAPSPGGGPPPGPPHGVVIAPSPGMPVGPPSGPPPGVRPERGGRRRGMSGRFRNMSQEERRQLRERFQNMSDEEREELRRQFRGGG